MSNGRLHYLRMHLGYTRNWCNEMIIIPMAGQSSRFRVAGYDKPKYMLELGLETVFALAVKSFSESFETEDFLFVIGENDGSEDFVRQQIQLLGIKNFEIVRTNGRTQGQADTVDIGLRNFGNIEDIVIFNIDTFRRQIFPHDFTQKFDGYLEVFNGTGDSWSFVLPGDDNKVLQTTEKIRISNLCSTGLYYFRNSNIFREALYKEKQSAKISELYVAPLFNHLIDKKLDVRFAEVPSENLSFCGVPGEYIELQKKVHNGIPIFA